MSSSIRSELDHRYYCVRCNRKRKLKFMYLIQLPFIYHQIRICMDCYHRLVDTITIIESAEADPRKVEAV